MKTGIIKAVCISQAKGTPKADIGKAEVITDFGLKDDAHAGNWHRQVSLLSLEKIEEFRKTGIDVDYGAFGENLVVSGIDLATLPIGTKLQCGAVLLELTQIGKECHQGCSIAQKTGKCIMPTEGVFARVLQGGTVEVGDQITVTD